MGKVAVNFGTSLNSKAAWNSFKKKTVDHGNQSNALMKSRNTAVQAWFAAKTASATAGAASTKAAAKAASKRVLRNTATKNSVDANTALTGANAAHGTAAATKNAALVASARTAQAASKATNDTAVCQDRYCQHRRRQGRQEGRRGRQEGRPRLCCCQQCLVLC